MCFASTPPLEATRLLLSELASRRTTVDGQPLEVSFIDVKTAYFNGIPTRRIHRCLPRELCLGAEAVAHLRRCVYGTRDAGMIWEETYTQALLDQGFRRRLASPCCFYHPELEVGVVIHGDDFTALGPREGLRRYREGLEQVFELNVKGHLGEAEKRP